MKFNHISWILVLLLAFDPVWAVRGKDIMCSTRTWDIIKQMARTTRYHKVPLRHLPFKALKHHPINWEKACQECMAWVLRAVSVSDSYFLEATAA